MALLLAGCEVAETGPLTEIPREFQGYWARDVAAQCENFELAGQSPEAPVAVNNIQVIEFGSTCTATALRRGGEGVVIAEMQCSGEAGEEPAEAASQDAEEVAASDGAEEVAAPAGPPPVTATLYRSGRALTFNRGAGSVVWTRCPPMLRPDLAAEAAAAEPLPGTDADAEPPAEAPAE